MRKNLKQLCGGVWGEPVPQNTTFFATLYSRLNNRRFTYYIKVLSMRKKLKTTVWEYEASLYPKTPLFCYIIQ